MAAYSPAGFPTGFIGKAGDIVTLVEGLGQVKVVAFGEVQRSPV
ncbi:MAG TPA: hypothetical protein PLT00_16255 [Verrucomicrobiota bacterium]|jgi:hypothetical protein|nr:hypothetical protein [Verrucomicrobiota bacterium]HQB18248.1 hypothetical protein [Verrucomicrobiota bacterium]